MSDSQLKTDLRMMIMTIGNDARDKADFVDRFAEALLEHLADRYPDLSDHLERSYRIAELLDNETVSMSKDMWVAFQASYKELADNFGKTRADLRIAESIITRYGTANPFPMDKFTKYRNAGGQFVLADWLAAGKPDGPGNHHRLCVTGTQPPETCTHCKELKAKDDLVTGTGYKRPENLIVGIDWAKHAREQRDVVMFFKNGPAEKFTAEPGQPGRKAVTGTDFAPIVKVKTRKEGLIHIGKVLREAAHDVCNDPDCPCSGPKIKPDNRKEFSEQGEREDKEREINITP